MIILSSKKCVPCKWLKEDLKRHGVKFEEIDVETPEGREIIRKIGIKAIPIVIDNEKVIMFGYNPDKVKELISKIKGEEI